MCVSVSFTSRKLKMRPKHLANPRYKHILQTQGRFSVQMEHGDLIDLNVFFKLTEPSVSEITSISCLLLIVTQLP